MNREQMIVHLTLLGWEPREQRVGIVGAQRTGILGASGFVFVNNHNNDKIQCFDPCAPDRTRAARNWADIDDKILGLLFDYIVKE